MQDAIGLRGEAIFTVLITKLDRPSGPYFKPQFLGDKWEAVDFLVELEGVSGMRPYFFVQVKATQQGYTAKRNRLKIRVEKERIRDLASYPAPTYIVGIDETTEKGWFVSANGEHLTSLSSLSTQFPINKRNRKALWEEVNEFWRSYPTDALTSRFNDPDWR